LPIGGLRGYIYIYIYIRIQEDMNWEKGKGRRLEVKNAKQKKAKHMITHTPSNVGLISGNSRKMVL